MNNPGKRHDEKLIGFKDYDAYLRYAQSMIQLQPDEYAALFQVLLKLQSLGQNPMEVLHQCKYRQGENDCLDMLKFMIYVDDLNLVAIKEQL